MITAMCFINAIPDQISSAGNAVAQVEGVCRVYSVTGKIDLVAVIEVKDHALALT